MKNKLMKGLLGGTAGTVMMSALMYMAPMIGLPKMNAAEILSGMMGTPLIVGWVMHFMIGIIFGILYILVFLKVIQKIRSKIMKGLLYGLAVFFVAQVVMAMMGKCMLCGENGMMVVAGSLMGHLLYGITLSLFNQ